jgi:hypothetical protein
MNMFSFREFLDYAERLYDDAKDKGKNELASPYIIGSILNAWMAIESFINNMMQDFASLPGGTFTTHELGFLEEKQVRFADRGAQVGTFYVDKNDEYKRLEDKILFLIVKFGRKKKIDKGTHLWQRFEKIKSKRNDLSHPRRKKEIILSLNDAKEAIEVAKSIISMVSKEVWNQGIKW